MYIMRKVITKLELLMLGISCEKKKKTHLELYSLMEESCLAYFKSKAI